MKIAYGILTAPRPEETLTGTLASLREAGFADPTIFAEPGTEISGTVSGLQVRYNQRTLGPWPNLINAITWLAAGDPEAEAVAVFQDDILASKGLRQWLEGGGLWPADPKGIGVVSLYAAKSIQNEFGSQDGGWFLLPPAAIPAKAFGALAYTFPRKSAVKLAVEFPQPETAKTSDLCTARWCKANGLEYWQHSPSFVEHTGKRSSISHRQDMGENRTAVRWLSSVPQNPAIAT